MIQERQTYAVRATIHDEGKLLYTSTNLIRDLTREAPSDNVDILMQKVG